MVAAPETLVSAAAQPAAPPALPTDSQPTNPAKEVKQNGASVNDGAASPGAESASSLAPANSPPAEVARNIPCRFFPLGQCKYGEHCIFSHGIPGTAGSPGVPPSPSVAAQVVNGQQGAQRQEHSLAQASGPNQHQHQHQHHQQQHQQAQQHHFQHTAPQHHQFHPQQISMEQAYAMQAAGMPFYYPEQAGLEYGYAPQVAFGGPQPGYYYPPHFAAAAAVQPPFPPQPYYAAGPVAQVPPPPPQVASVEQSAVSPPPAAVSPSHSSAPATSPSPADPSASAAEAPVENAAAAVAPVEAASAAPVDPLAAAAGAAVPPVASLHTFFQTGPPAGMPPALLAGAPNGAPYMRNGVPRGPMGPRRSIGGPNGPIPGPGGKRASFGNARPPCSFFEANRCRHGDKCLFVHLLPDGSDARALGRGLIGIDGRTEHPEATGGMPPAWLATQKAIKAANQTARKHHEQGTILNGGYSYRERMSAQTNAQEQAAPSVPPQDANGAASSQEESVSATPSEATQPAPVSASVPDASAPVPAAIQQQQQQQRPIPNGANQRNGPLPPGSAAPQLVAAINGLTRRIPPAHINKQQGGPAGQRQGHQQQNGMHAHQQQHNNGQKQQQRKPQRVPSGENDFPALSPAAPSSPAFEKEGFAAALAAPAPAPASAPAPPATAEKPAPAPVAESAKPTSPSEETEGFVMVSHADAGVPAPAESKAEASSAPAPTAAAPAPAAAAPRPKLIGGWASAAARGASVVVPEKPKARAFSPVVVNRSATPAAENKDAPAPVKKEESAPAAAAKKDSREREKVDEDGFVRQQPKRKGGAHKANKAAPQHQQPVAIKA